MSTTNTTELSVFETVINSCLNKVNQTQYFLPGLSWFFVFYTYMSIGEGKIWKYLFYVTSAGFAASICANFQDSFKGVIEKDYLLQIKWIEGILWGINEFGFVYISYMKLSTVVQELKKKVWKYIMEILFVYTIIIRFHLAYCNIAGRRNDAGSHKHGLNYVPFGLVEVIFMILIIKTSLKESTKNQISKGVITTMLNSSLSRMFLVALVFFSASILCFFFQPLYMKYLKNIAWRVKAIIGLIFLLDLLLIRIELRDQVSKPQSSDLTYTKPMNMNSNYTNTNNDTSYMNNASMIALNKNNSMKTYNYNNQNLQKKYDNNIKYYNNNQGDEDIDLNKFNLPSDPIIVKMTPTSSSPFDNNDYTNSSFSKPKMSDKYFNQLKHY